MNTTIKAENMKQPRRWPAWPLGITIFLALFVLGLVGFLIFAGTQKVEMVTDNYYEKTLEYQAQIDRVNRTKALSEPVLLCYEPAENRYLLRFPALFDPGEISGEVTFYRPNDARADVAFPLQVTADGGQIFSTARLAPGLWRVKVVWAAGGEGYYNEGYFVRD